ncbi:hypothetical protein BJY52DRAFT_1313142 [Lactarius psammicola]|nr:hypothetical protein BJY52DRAFT_1313142 [Lactarius psammicola]
MFPVLVTTALVRFWSSAFSGLRGSLRLPWHDPFNPISRRNTNSWAPSAQSSPSRSSTLFAQATVVDGVVADVPCKVLGCSIRECDRAMINS